MAAEPIKITEPGIYEMSAEDYHADLSTPVWSLSSSGARELKSQPPGYFAWRKRHPEEIKKTPALDFGTAAHAWLLEGATWLDRYWVLSEGHNATTKDGKAEIAEAMLAKKTPIKHEAFAHIKGMREVLGQHKFALQAFEQEGRRESSLFWRDPHTGIWCRSRPDFLPARGRVFADYKTARSVTDEALSRTIASYGYHMQADWYGSGIRALGLYDEPVMLLVFQEPTPPYLVRSVVIDRPAMIAAEGDNYRSRRIFAECLAANAWPGYPEEIIEVGLPGWELTKAENRYAEDTGGEGQ